MTDQELIDTSRQLTVALMTFCERAGVSGADMAHLSAMALSEVLAQQLGPFGAIERLRDVADVLERGLVDGRFN